MKTFKDIRETIDYPEIRKYLKKMKDKEVSYTALGGKIEKGKFGGLMNRGGRSYAKVHTTGPKGGLALVPLPQIKYK